MRVCKDRDTGKEYAMKIIDKEKCRGKEHFLETEVIFLFKISKVFILYLFKFTF